MISAKPSVATYTLKAMATGIMTSRFRFSIGEMSSGELCSNVVKLNFVRVDLVCLECANWEGERGQDARRGDCANACESEGCNIRGNRSAIRNLFKHKFLV